jgi:hypothetical protein
VRHYERVTSLSGDLAALVTSEAARAIPGCEVDFGTGDIVVTMPNAEARVALDSLLTQLQYANPGTAPELVRRWFDEVASSLSAAAGADGSAQRPRMPDPAALRLQVVPRTSAIPPGAARQPVPHEFEAVVLAVEGPGRLGVFGTQEAGQIGGVAEAVEMALRETVGAELADVAVTDHELAGQPIRMISKPGSPFVTAALMSLTSFLITNVPDGAFVIAPTYDTIVFHEVHSRASIDLIADLAAMAADLAGASRAPCSPDVYWWYGQQFNRIGITYADGEPQLDFPTELRDVVWSLS